jgi:hypothetical protein
MCQATCSLFHFLCVVVKSWFAKDCLNCSESGVHICTRHSPRLVIILPAIFSTVLTAIPSSRMAFSTLIAVDVPLPCHLSFCVYAIDPLSARCYQTIALWHSNVDEVKIGVPPFRPMSRCSHSTAAISQDESLWERTTPEPERSRSYRSGAPRRGCRCVLVDGERRQGFGIQHGRHNQGKDP